MKRKLIFSCLICCAFCISNYLNSSEEDGEELPRTLSNVGSDTETEVALGLFERDKDFCQQPQVAALAVSAVSFTQDANRRKIEYCISSSENPNVVIKLFAKESFNNTHPVLMKYCFDALNYCFKRRHQSGTVELEHVDNQSPGPRFFSCCISNETGLSCRTKISYADFNIERIIKNIMEQFFWR